MRISELAERAGVSTRTLRDGGTSRPKAGGEARGLLSAPRAANGYRVYDDADLEVVRQIRTLQGSGFGLEETRPFVECLRAGHPRGDSCPDSLDVYRRKLAEIDALMERLRAVRAEVSERLLRSATEPKCHLGGSP
ncbi:MerR family transcriptional regulator [Streptomyces xiamenensis]|uniref:MerR family transcriptional regulator n=1 Tax=Streptomyces xiamenensis TaxID=408015 RepID=A0A0F7FV37_9ACTN|nr:MerR family transcriptional regulator [Streptomyces xiamenensis]AKG44035.1 MerR family transcriptional regulator [Streptomyces xiamenensis]